MVLKPFIPRYRRSSLLFWGFVIGMSLLFFVKRLGNDDDIDQKLQTLYSETFSKNEMDIMDEYNKRMRNPETLAKINSYVKNRCINYLDYSQQIHDPLSQGPLKLSYQRPPKHCCTFHSDAVEKLIEDLKKRISNPDLARLLENTLPNTLDTTILWHKVKESTEKYSQTFVVTGDIHAEWLRDAARQLSVYQHLTQYDDKLKELIRGAINTQASYILISPYCNAFHPPPKSGIKKSETTYDKVFPKPNWKHVFECKWEIDSLASFLTLTNEYYEVTKDSSIFNELWINAIINILTVLKRESSPTFDDSGKVLPSYYTFQRTTNIGTETLSLDGAGNPVNFNIGLIRSAFRPSDDATIYQFFIPGNAHMSVELGKIAKILNSLRKELKDIKELDTIITNSQQYSETIKKAIYEHAIFEHKEFGKVFAYEIDGYGGANFMDDANIPSLLSLPDLGFIECSDPIYQNTRNMILSKRGNPYYIIGRHFKGIGGPHVGISNAWPMSLLLQIRTSYDDDEILDCLNKILENTGNLGLIHESIQVDVPHGLKFTRPWFSWANSEFGKTILDLAERKPHLIFKDKEPYKFQG